MIIDLHLLRLRYEILNISLADIASELEVPPSLLEKEAQVNKWKQWWPGTLADQADIDADTTGFTPTPLITDNSPTVASLLDDDTHPDLEASSPMEEAADLYLKEQRIRLQVFTLAKDIHLAHKYASLESALVDRAKDMIPMTAEPSDVRNLVLSLKDLPGKIASGSVAVGQNEDGLPMVIIRDLSGR